MFPTIPILPISILDDSANNCKQSSKHIFINKYVLFSMENSYYKPLTYLQVNGVVGMVGVLGVLGTLGVLGVLGVPGSTGVLGGLPPEDGGL